MACDLDVIPVEVPPGPDVIEVVVPGEQGPAGPPGSSGALTYEQAAPAATWIIAHPLNRLPLVAVYDAGGAEMIADVFADNSTVSVVFAQPTAGSAVLF